MPLSEGRAVFGLETATTMASIELFPQFAKSTIESLRPIDGSRCHAIQFCQLIGEFALGIYLRLYGRRVSFRRQETSYIEELSKSTTIIVKKKFE